MFCYCQTVLCLLMWGELSDGRTDLQFPVAAGSRQRSHSRVRIPRDSRPYIHIYEPLRFRRQVAVAQSVWFACGLRATESYEPLRTGFGMATVSIGLLYI
jgi:hypothetical protein